MVSTAAPVTDKTRLLAVASFVGLAGDAVLQLLAALGVGGRSGWGLVPYFERHGPAESLFIAGGIMALFHAVFLLTPLPVRYPWLALYGAAVDALVFRWPRLLPSLNRYYQENSVVFTATWGAIPMCLPTLVCSLLWGHT
jgi:hypothetical protein